jgi:hypothetical protein
MLTAAAAQSLQDKQKGARLSRLGTAALPWVLY